MALHLVATHNDAALERNTRSRGAKLTSPPQSCDGNICYDFSFIKEIFQQRAIFLFEQRSVQKKIFPFNIGFYLTLAFEVTPPIQSREKTGKYISLKWSLRRINLRYDGELDILIWILIKTIISICGYK